MEFGQLHHIEYFVSDLAKSNEFWDWFMPYLGYSKFQQWVKGVSWAHKNGTYIVFVQIEPNFLSTKNNRQGSGLNHIAFKGKSFSHLVEIKNELTKRLIEILAEDEQHLCFEDPNGFAIEIFL